MKVTKVRITNFKSLADTGEVDLDQINVLVGRNNHGKSSFLQAALLMQQPPPPAEDVIRLGETGSEIDITLDGPGLEQEVRSYFQNAVSGHPVTLSIGLTAGGFRFFLGHEEQKIQVGQIRPQEPHNFIYAYLSKRKVSAFDQVVDINRTRSLPSDLRFLVSKVARLSNPDYEHYAEYEALCQEVLGFRITVHASAQGQQAGIPVGPFGYIPLEAMGEGVSSQLGLITDLCMARGSLFLIEEPENDIHPEGLKRLLDVIIEKSQTNQFVVTTHSNIVTRYLGAAPNSKILEFESTFIPNAVPTSTIRDVQSTPEARIEVLTKLGYELSDFDLWDGWLILEESSAEFVLRYLIPWFVPRLARVRTVSAGGVGKVEATFEDYRRLFLFAHLEPVYRGRAWVIVDGDDAGREVIANLRAKYSMWPADHFSTWDVEDFERYYPARFEARVTEMLAKPHDQRWAAKQALHAEVSAWCRDNPDEAKAALSTSAREVISVLEGIDGALFGTPMPRIEPRG